KVRWGFYFLYPTLSRSSVFQTREQHHGFRIFGCCNWSSVTTGHGFPLWCTLAAAAVAAAFATSGDGGVTGAGMIVTTGAGTLIVMLGGGCGTGAGITTGAGDGTGTDKQSSSVTPAAFTYLFAT